MQNIWKFVRRRLAQVVTLMALVGLIQGVGHAQTLAVSPGLSSAIAGDPALLIDASTTIPSPPTYVGPASGLVPDEDGFSQSAVVDKYGNVYVGELTGNIIRVIASGNGPIPVLGSSVTPQAGYVYTVAGTGIDSSSNANPVSSNCTTSTGETDSLGDGCPATQAVFGQGVVLGIAVDSNGNIYIPDSSVGLIRVIYGGGTGTLPGLTSPKVGYIYSIAGVYGNTTTVSGDGVQATSAPINSPQYLAIDGNGSIYFYDGSKKVLRVVANGSVPGLPNIPTPTVGYLYTIVGSTGTVKDGVPASMSKINSAGGITVDSSGNIYIADTGDHEVRVVSAGVSVPGLTGLTPGNIYDFAGGTTATKVPLFFTPALASTVQIQMPASVAIDPAGELYIVDSQNKRVMRVDLSGNLTVVYGKATDASYTCDAATDQEVGGCISVAIPSTSVPAPTNVAIDQQGNLYMTDGGLLVLRESNVSTASLYFTPGQMQPVILYNTGTAALTLSSFTPSSPFTVVPLSSTPPAGITADCNALPTLQPGESCESQLQFPSTTNTAAATGTLTVGSNTPGGTTTIQLTGESAANAALTGTSLRWNPVPTNTAAVGTPESFKFLLQCSTGCASNGAFPTGSLTLYSGSTVIAGPQQVTLTSSNANLPINGVTLPTGNNLLYAVYGGDVNYASSRSPQAEITVNGTASTTMLAASASTIATNSTVTLTATVASSSGNPSDGTVTFKNGNVVIGTAPVSGGTAMLTTPNLTTAGTDTFTASYAGSTTYNPSTSNAVPVTVEAPIGTATAVSAMPTAPAAGASVALTAMVTAASGTTAPTTGTVQFYYALNGAPAMALGSPVNVTAGTGTTATATLNSVTTLPVGTDTITASYSGSTDTLFQPSSTMTATSATVRVGLPGTTTTITPLTGSTTYGSSYTFTVTVAPQVTGNTTPSGTVTFTAGTTNLGSATVTSGNATFTTTQLPGGSSTVTDTVTATFNDPTNTFASSTGTASVSVSPLATVTNTPTSSNLNPVSGQTLTLTTTVTATGSSAQPTGTVTFYNNGALVLCSATLSSGSASCPTSLLPQGADMVTAVFVGGNGFTTSTSSALSLTVAPPSASTATALTASTTSASTTQPVTFTATVTNTTTGSTGIPTGVVTFQSGSTVLGTGPLSGSGVATFTTTFTKTGAYPVVAIYQGNSSYTGSTSPTPVTVTVTQALAMSTTSLTLSSSAVQQGSNVTFTATVAPASTSTTITPTGTVTFYNGGQQIPSSTSTLNGGIATFSIATLNAGTYSVTAEYSGDVNYSGSNSTATPLTVGAPTPSFTVSATPTNLTLTSGQSGAAIITLIPTFGYTGTVALSCGTLPANVTCSFSPASLTADGKNDTVQSTLTISTTGAATATASAAHPDGPERNGSMRSLAFLFVPSGLLLWGFAGRRKRLVRYLPLLMLGLLTASLVGLSGCGGSNGGSSQNAATGTSKITVTAAGSAGSQSQTVNLNITIQ
ncbi:MAG: Ig-like domain repeat protein [Edaphobacter sp.]